MGTVVQAGICDFRKIIIFHELRLKTEAKKPINKGKNKFWISFLLTENFAGYKVLVGIDLTLNLQMPPVTAKSLLHWNDFISE